MIWWLEAKPIILSYQSIGGYHPNSPAVPKLKGYAWWKDEDESACILEQLFAIYKGWDTTEYPSWWRQGEPSSP
jgi:hypothetical protein